MSMPALRALCRIPFLRLPSTRFSSLTLNFASISNCLSSNRDVALIRTHDRSLTSTTPFAIQFPPRRIFLDSEIEENFLKGSGPGGQKINKTSSAVQLKHLPTGIVVKCQESRSRSHNRKVARKLLGERLEELELGEESRTAVKARERSRKKASADKKKRRKYRALSDGQDGEAHGDEADALDHHAGEGSEQINSFPVGMKTEPQEGPSKENNG